MALLGARARQLVAHLFVGLTAKLASLRLYLDFISFFLGCSEQLGLWTYRFCNQVDPGGAVKKIAHEGERLRGHRLALRAMARLRAPLPSPRLSCGARAVCRDAGAAAPSSPSVDAVLCDRSCGRLGVARRGPLRPRSDGWPQAVPCRDRQRLTPRVRRIGWRSCAGRVRDQAAGLVALRGLPAGSLLVCTWLRQVLPSRGFAHIKYSLKYSCRPGCARSPLFSIVLSFDFTITQVIIFYHLVSINIIIKLFITNMPHCAA